MPMTTYTVGGDLQRIAGAAALGEITVTVTLNSASGGSPGEVVDGDTGNQIDNRIAATVIAAGGDGVWATPDLPCNIGTTQADRLEPSGTIYTVTLQHEGRTVLGPTQIQLDADAVYTPDGNGNVPIGDVEYVAP